MLDFWLHPVGQTIAVAAILFGVTALAYSFTKAEWMMRVVRHGGLLDPLSALELSLARRKRGPVTVVVIEWDLQGGVTTARDLTLDLKAMVRQSDDVFPLDERRTIVVLGTSTERLERVLERWRLALLMDGHDGAIVRVGVAVPGADGHTAEELLSAATSQFSTQAESGRPPARGEPLAALPAGAREAEDDQAEFLDPVTQLLKPEWMSGAARKWIASRRYRGRPITVLQIHVHGLGSISRRFGEEVGRAVLRACAEVLSANLREDDLLGAWADHSFLAVVDCTALTALKIAQRLVACVRESGVTVGAGRVTFMICVGLAGIGGPGVTPSHVIDAAGVAAAEAVRRGPGACLLYDRSMERRQPTEPPVEDRW